MITFIKVKNVAGTQGSTSRKLVLAKGMSTDAKPTEYANGSRFEEMDTGKTYAFNEETNLWIAEAAKYLASIAQAGTTAAYNVGDDAVAGTLTATYTDETTAEISSDNYTLTPSEDLQATDDELVFSYTENGIRRTTSVDIVVSRFEVTIPTPVATLSYDGTEQTITWTNFDDTKMSKSGSEAETNAGTYEVVFTLLDPDTYCWDDTEKTIAPTTVAWSIDPIAITVTADSDSKTYDGTALTDSGYTLTGTLVTGDSETVVITGTITNAGTADNVVTSVTIYADETDVTANYDITEVDGTLTVNKATAVLSALPVAVELEAAGEPPDSAEVAVTWIGDGTITAVSNDEDIVTVAVVDHTVTITCVPEAVEYEAIVTIGVVDAVNYNDPTDVDIAVTISTI